MNTYFEERPWGNFTVLEDSATFKVKKIEVNPNQRLSYQRHFKRSEHWYMVSGRAIVVLDNKEIPLEKNQYIDIPLKAAHRILNPDSKEKLVFIEIQTGEYFGEDDIERLSDDYGRNT